MPENMEAPDNTAGATEMFANECDVILVVGDEKQRMRVSSVILSMASSVFKALLGPHFREGQQQRNSTSPVEIPLPDDSSASMRDILNILHFRPGSVAQEDDDDDDYIREYEYHENAAARYLQDMAIAADKYDLAGAVHAHAKCMLRSFIDKYAIYEFVGPKMCAVVAAYVLDQRSAFTAITGTLIRDVIEPLSFCFGTNGSAPIPDMRLVPQILPMLLTERSVEAQRYLFTAVQQISGQPDCGFTHSFADVYWKLDFRYDVGSKTLQGCINRLQKREMEKASGCKCGKSSEHKKCIRKIVAKLQRMGHGLCLVCVRENRVTYDSDICEDHGESPMDRLCPSS